MLLINNSDLLTEEWRFLEPVWQDPAVRWEFGRQVAITWRWYSVFPVDSMCAETTTVSNAFQGFDVYAPKPHLGIKYFVCGFYHLT